MARDGSIDWACPPCFYSSPIFARILGEPGRIDPGPLAPDADAEAMERS